MFYADFVLSKKGPLARIWLAAHWDKKLTRAQIFETNVESSIERILKPKVKLALRTSGHLMLGVVRIYSRKTKYLLADCNEVFLKIKSAFRPGMLDLPEDHREAVVTAFTQSVVFPDFDAVMPDLDSVDIEAQFTLNQSRVDEITMAEDYGPNTMLSSDPAGFGNDGFGAPGDGPDSHSSNVFFGGSIEGFDKNDDIPVVGALGGNIDLDKNNAFANFGGVLYEDAPIVDALMDGSAFHDQIQPDQPIPSTSKDDQPLEGPLNDDFDDHFAPPSPGSSLGSRPASPINAEIDSASANVPGVDQFLADKDLNEAVVGQNEIPAIDSENDQNVGNVGLPEKPTDQTTLLQNEEESFALAPVDASALKGLPKSKRKRKLVVDEVKNISGDEMKAQLSDTTDIVTTLDLAPPTKRLMHWKETGGVEKLFALPGKTIPSTSLFKNYQRHLVSKAVPNDDNIEDREVLEVTRDGVQDALETVAASAMPPPTRRGRKRKTIDLLEDKPDQLVNVSREEPEKRVQLDDLRLSANFEELPSYNPLPNESLPTQDLPPAAAVVDDILPNNEIEEPQPQPQPQPQPPIVMENTTNENQPLPPEDIFSSFHQDQNMEPLAQEPVSTNKETLMENMGYDGQDQELIQNFGDINPITPGINPGGITPWHENEYENPVSVEPQDERGDDETVEQFEERVLNKRAGQLSSTIKARISSGTRTTFDDLIRGNSRKQVAQKFYSLLVLKKYQVIELTQEEPYATIMLTKGSHFDDPKLS